MSPDLGGHHRENRNTDTLLISPQSPHRLPTGFPAHSMEPHGVLSAGLNPKLMRSLTASTSHRAGPYRPSTLEPGKPEFKSQLCQFLAV